MSHDFIVTNEGDDALLIYEVVPGCGCTVVSYEKFLPPGKSGKIRVSVELYREWAGMDYAKSVTVISSDPVNPRVRLHMKGEIAPLPPPSRPAPKGGGPEAPPDAS
jgi:hypothetical protein